MAIYAMVIFSILSTYSYLSSPKKPHCEDGLLLDFFCNKNKLKAIIITSLCIFFTLFSSSNFILLLGCDDIRIMPKGTYCYYVYATNENGNTYTLPANISKINRTEYGIKNVYFKNGGYLYFSDFDYIKFDDEFNAHDQNNNEWQIELTTHKTTHPKVKETSPLNVGVLIVVFIATCFHLINGVFYVRSIDYEKKLKEEKAIKNQLPKKIPNEIPMNAKDVDLMYSWDDYITNLQVSKSNIEKYLEEHTIANIKNAYRNNFITEEQYKTAKEHIDDVELLNEIIIKRLDDIIDNQNLLLDKYYIDQ